MSRRPRTRSPRVRVRHPAAELLPVARVALLTPVPHLDRDFDYEVPEKLAAAAVPGVRVRVRLAGRLVDGFVLERVETSERELQPLSSVHGPAVLTPEIAALCRAVADRYAGTLADVLRFAIPPRHARVESRALAAPVDPGRLSPSTLPGGRPIGAGLSCSQGSAARFRCARCGCRHPGSRSGCGWPTSPAPWGRAVASVLIIAPDAAEVDRIMAALVDGGISPAATRRGVRSGGPLPGVPGRAFRGRPRRRRHPGGGVRPRRRPRRDHRLGRRGRVPGRAAGPRVACPGGRRPAQRRRGHRPWWSAARR